VKEGQGFKRNFVNNLWPLFANLPVIFFFPLWPSLKRLEWRPGSQKNMIRMKGLGAHLAEVLKFFNLSFIWIKASGILVKGLFRGE